MLKTVYCNTDKKPVYGMYIFPPNLVIAIFTNFRWFSTTLYGQMFVDPYVCISQTFAHIMTAARKEFISSNASFLCTTYHRL